MIERVPRRTQSERTEDTRQKIVLATIKLLKRKGYAGLRTAGVAATAGISRGGLLHHFSTKDELVLASVEFILRRAREQAMRRVSQAQECDDVLAAATEDARDFFFSQDFAVVLDLVLMGGKNPDFRSHIYRYAQQHREPVEAAWLELLVVRGLARQQAEQLLALTLSIVRGISIRALWEPDEALFDSLITTWRQMVDSWIAQN